MSSSPPVAIDAGAKQRERSLLTAGLSDLILILVAYIVAIWANSLMMGAEALRGTLLVSLEMVLLVLMRRIHRGRTHTFDYGAGKLEQFANLGIGTAMGLGGLWVAGAAAFRWWNPPVQGDVGLYFAAVFGMVNVAQNGWAFRSLSRAGRSGDSVIMIGQIRTRLAKLLSSCLVLGALCVNAVFAGTLVGTAAEVLGSAFVSLIMLELAVSMWRRAMPSLLDSTLQEAQQDLINRALVAHFEDYDELVAVRSRISGNTPLVEIILGFATHRQIGEIQRIIDKVAEAVRNLLPGSHVTVIPVEWQEPL